MGGSYRFGNNTSPKDLGERPRFSLLPKIEAESGHGAELHRNPNPTGVYPRRGFRSGGQLSPQRACPATRGDSCPRPPAGPPPSAESLIPGGCSGFRAPRGGGLGGGMPKYFSARLLSGRQAINPWRPGTSGIGDRAAPSPVDAGPGYSWPKASAAPRPHTLGFRVPAKGGWPIGGAWRRQYGGATTHRLTKQAHHEGGLRA
jgi:hypothetical protein